MRILLVLLLACGSCAAQMSEGYWDEIVGKKVVNPQGVTLGHVADSVLDIEHGRYVGMLVTYGGFLGIGQQHKIVPPGAFKDTGVRRTLSLDMDKATFRNAPTFVMSAKVGPPLVADVARVYNYFGQPAYFTSTVESTPSSRQTREQVGYTERGSKILNMPVDNLQGRPLGNVIGLRGLDRKSGRLNGVVIRTDALNSDDKIVEPQALRYNLHHNRLRLNNHEQAFHNAPDFYFAGGTTIFEQSPVRPGNPRLPVVQGTSERDKRITQEIINGVLQDGSLTHYARNIQIGTVKGKTTVRGRVETPRDLQRIVAVATKAAGPGNVTVLLDPKVMSAWEKGIDTSRDFR